MHQGWPKFTAHLWMTTPDEGIAAAAYAPSRVTFSPHGVPAEIGLDTDYPFRETLTIAVAVNRPVRFPLVLRVPAWAEGASVRLGSGPEQPMRPGTFHRIEHDWTGTERLRVRFPMTPAASRRYNGAVAIERGPLVYALKIGEQWTRVNADKPHRDLPHGDFEVRPTTPWNYALEIDEEHPGASIRFDEVPIGERPFSPEGAGMRAAVSGRRIPSWTLAHGWAAEISPADAAWADPDRHVSDEPLETVTLIPYGCTNIRITEFPKLGPRSDG
jgi:hypothetical protein